GRGGGGRAGRLLVTRLLRPNGPPGRGQAPPLLWVSADGRREKGLGGTMPVDKNDLPVPPPLADPGRLAEARGRLVRLPRSPGDEEGGQSGGGTGHQVRETAVPPQLLARLLLRQDDALIADIAEPGGLAADDGQLLRDQHRITALRMLADPIHGLHAR